MKNKTQFQIEPGKQELTITREFEAPRELVFRAHAEPELVAQWLGPRELEMEVEAYEARTGGRYRFIHSAPRGKFIFNGVFHWVDSPALMVRTFEYEGLPERGHVSLETLRFESLPGGRTRVTTHCVFQSTRDRDWMIESGMEGGVLEGHERLDELLAKPR